MCHHANDFCRQSPSTNTRFISGSARPMGIGNMSPYLPPYLPNKYWTSDHTLERLTSELTGSSPTITLTKPVNTEHGQRIRRSSYATPALNLLQRMQRTKQTPDLDAAMVTKDLIAGTLVRGNNIFGGHVCRSASV
jgi:hypothetical protein